jgi:hypothetical protein
VAETAEILKSEEESWNAEIVDEELERDELESEFIEEEGLENQDNAFGVWSSETVGIKRLKMLLYGVSGTGKTTFAATFPRPLFLDLESGLRSTLRVKPVLRYPANPDEDVKNYQQVVDFYQLVRSAVNPQFDTIVIDSLNELQVLVTHNVVTRFTGVRRQYDDQLTMADYGKANRDFMKVIRLFLKLPYHVVFTAIASQREPGDEETQVFPKFVGKQVGPDLQRMMDMIGYCHAKRMPDGSSQHYVSFHITPQYVAKDRMGIVNRDIPNNFDSLINSVRS